jgi:serine/threonine protein kinase
MEQNRIFIENIGTGSQGTVDKYKLIDENKEVAIKKSFTNIPGDIDASTLKELNIFQKLKNCETIVQLISAEIVKTPDGLELIMVMPLYQSDLSKFIRDNPFRIRIQYFDSIMEQLFNALHNLYYSGIIHNDIKPDNIFLNIENNQPKIALADFGLAVQLPCDPSYRHLDHPISGTPLYMAPEVLKGDSRYTDKADIWSAGITLMQYLTDAVVTEPPNDILNSFSNSFDALLYQIDSISFKGHIDVQAILLYYLTENEYDLISSENRDKLIQMLYIDDQYRARIIDLYDSELCKKTPPIERNELKNYKLLPLYYTTVDLLLSICRSLNINPIIFYLSIDLLERYLSVNDVSNLFEMTLYALSSLNLNYKLYEGVNLDYKKLLRGVSNKITLKDLFLAQYKFLQKLDYLITSCYTDEFVQALSILADKYLKQYGSQYPRENNEKVYSLLYKMYKRIQNDKVYPGNLHPFEMIDYLARDGI